MKHTIISINTKNQSTMQKHSDEQYIHSNDKVLNQMHPYEYQSNDNYKQEIQQQQQSYIPPSQYQRYQQDTNKYNYSNPNVANYARHHMSRDNYDQVNNGYQKIQNQHISNNQFNVDLQNNYAYQNQYAPNLDQFDTQQNYIQSHMQGPLRNSQKIYATNLSNNTGVNTNHIFIKQMKLVCQIIIDQNQQTIEELTGQNLKIMNQYKVFKKLILSGKFNKQPLNNQRIQKMYQHAIRSNQTYPNQFIQSNDSYFPKTIAMQKDLNSLQFNQIKSPLNPNYGFQKKQQFIKSTNSQFEEKLFDLRSRGKQSQIQENQKTIKRLLETKKQKQQSVSEEQSYLIEGQNDIFNLNQNGENKYKNEGIKDKQRLLEHQRELLQQKNYIVQFLKQFLSDLLQYAPEKDYYDRKLSKKQIMLIYTQWRKVDFFQKYKNGGLNPSSVQMQLTKAFKRTFGKCQTEKYHFIGIQYIGEYMAQDILNLLKSKKMSL